MDSKGLNTRVLDLVKRLSCFYAEEQIQDQVDVHELGRGFIPISSLLKVKRI